MPQFNVYNPRKFFIPSLKSRAQVNIGPQVANLADQHFAFLKSYWRSLLMVGDEVGKWKDASKP
jgi:hypothetical protein